MFAVVVLLPPLLVELNPSAGCLSVCAPQRCAVRCSDVLLDLSKGVCKKVLSQIQVPRCTRPRSWSVLWRARNKLGAGALTDLIAVDGRQHLKELEIRRNVLKFHVFSFSPSFEIVRRRRPSPLRL